jgi:hypothetical protein
MHAVNVPPLSARARAEQALIHSAGSAAVDMLEASRAANVGIGWALLALADTIAAAGIPAPRVSVPRTSPPAP